MTSKQQDFISSLSKTLTPKKYHTPFSLHYMGLFFSTLILILILNLGLSTRPDLSSLLREGHYLSDIFFLVVLVFSGAFSALYGSIPKPVNILHRLYLVPLLLWVGWNGYHVVTYIQSHAGQDFVIPQAGFCTLKLLLVSILPLSLLVWLVRKGLSPHPKLGAFAAVLSAASLGALAVHLGCPSNDFGHVFLFHFIPILLLAVASSWFARYLINKH